jgi:hypothetical protein
LVRNTKMEAAAAPARIAAETASIRSEGRAHSLPQRQRLGSGPHRNDAAAGQLKRDGMVMTRELSKLPPSWSNATTMAADFWPLTR